MTEILVYTDGGVGASDTCVAMTTECLKHAVSHEPRDYVVHTTAEEIMSGALDSCCLLVMPGGRDIPYMDKLKGRGNSLIKQFVAGGGSYLGICAGAYYASSFVDFARGDPVLEVAQWRELQFFTGSAVGPLYAGFDYQSQAGAKATEIHLTDSGRDNDTLTVYYNGGCHFTDRLPPAGLASPMLTVDAAASCEVVATYSSGEVAVLRRAFGKGRVVLSGVHLEASSELLDRWYHGDKHIAMLLDDVKTFDVQRNQFVQLCLTYLLQNCSVCG